MHPPAAVWMELSQLLPGHGAPCSSRACAFAKV